MVPSMDVHRAIRERRSIRIFKKDPLPKNIITSILDAGRWAPTGCNKQLFEIISIEKPKLRRRVAKLSNNETYFYQAPVIFLVLYDTSKELVREGVAPDIPAITTGALVQNMLLEAHSLGVGSLVVGAITKKKQLRKLLKIPDCYEPMCFVLFGYPDEKPFTPPRRSINDFVHINKFGNLISGQRRKGPLYPNSPNPKKWNWKEFVEFKQRIVHFGGYTGKCEPTGITSLTMSLLDIVSMHIKTLKITKILDLFPANGIFLRPLAWRLLSDKNTQLFTVEFSEGTAQYIKHILKQDEISIQADALKLTENNEITFPYKEKTFDAVTCFFRLENLPTRLPVLKESWRVLKEDGIMFITFFRKWAPYDMLRRLISLNKPNDFNKRWHWKLGPWSALSKKTIAKELEKAGFKISGEYHFYDITSILKPVIVGLPSLIGLSSPLKKSTYCAPIKEGSSLSSVVLLEVHKKRG